MIGNEGRIENQPIKEMLISKVNKINPPSIEQVIQKPNKVLIQNNSVNKDKTILNPGNKNSRILKGKREQLSYIQY